MNSLARWQLWQYWKEPNEVSWYVANAGQQTVQTSHCACLCAWEEGSEDTIYYFLPTTNTYTERNVIRTTSFICIFMSASGAPLAYWPSMKYYQLINCSGGGRLVAIDWSGSGEGVQTSDPPAFPVETAWLHWRLACGSPPHLCEWVTVCFVGGEVLRLGVGVSPAAVCTNVMLACQGLANPPNASLICNQYAWMYADIWVRSVCMSVCMVKLRLSQWLLVWNSLLPKTCLQKFCWILMISRKIALIL